jgi:hypothetical protein
VLQTDREEEGKEQRRRTEMAEASLIRNPMLLTAYYEQI